MLHPPYVQEFDISKNILLQPPLFKNTNRVAVPGEVGGVGSEDGLGREGERAAVQVGEFEVGASGEDGFGDVILGDADAEVVIDGPETGIEEVMGGRGKG